jgi:hypothetical protein
MLPYCGHRPENASLRLNVEGGCIAMPDCGTAAGDAQGLRNTAPQRWPRHSRHPDLHKRNV